MSVVLGCLVWVVLAVLGALGLGRAIRYAEQRDRSEPSSRHDTRRAFPHHEG